MMLRSFNKPGARTYALLVLVVCSAFLAAFSGVRVRPLIPAFSGDSSNLFRFRNETELVMFLGEQPGRYVSLEDPWGVLVLSGFNSGAKGLGALNPLAVTSSVNVKFDVSSVSSEGYSTTNVQVMGVDEADIVKTDGKYIYYVRGNKVFIIHAVPAEQARIVSTLSFTEDVFEIFVTENRLVVIQQGALAGKTVSPKSSSYTVSDATVMRIYDTSNVSSPTLIREIRVEGYYQTSRLTGGFVYLISQKQARVLEGRLDLPTVQSRTVWGTVTRKVEASQIYYVDTPEPYYAYTVVMGVSVADPEDGESSETFLLGPSSVEYVSPTSIFIASQHGDETTVYKLGLKAGLVTLAGEGKVPGRALNQFSMDEHDGYFRIATTSGRLSRSGGGTSNNVYVLNGEMKTVGKLEDLAPGESIYSARFMGSRCYLVTFKKVDPLFTIDLSDPEEPKVLGKLKIPGYSDYLHPFDETHLIGIGKETVEAEQGNFAWYQGLKISLFDVSDVANPRELAKLEVGDRGTDSPALRDHKAFLFSRDRELLILPILEARIDPSRYAGTPSPNAYGEFVYQGAYVFHLGLDGIRLDGKVTHLTGGELLKSGYYFDSVNSVKRALYIGNVLYTVSDGTVTANSLTDLSLISTVKLP